MRYVKFMVLAAAMLFTALSLSAFLMDRAPQTATVVPQQAASSLPATPLTPPPFPAECAGDGSPCSDPNNTNPQPPLCSDCCNGYHDCDGLACICGPSQ